MRRSILVIVAAFLGLFSTTWAQDQTLLDRIESIRADNDVPALAVAGFDAVRIAPVIVVGHLAHGNDALADETSKFHMGSLTKSMTATLAARLVEQGLIQWETTLEQAMPQTAERVPEPYRSVTLEQLLTHRSGLPDDRRPGGVTARYFALRGPMREQRVQAVQIAFEQPGLKAPGEQFAYSNSGYIVAGAMLEAVTDANWEDLMQEQVFAPLGITSAGFGPPVDDAGRLTQPLGHLDRMLGRMPVAPGPGADNPAVLGPAGTVHMTIADLARYARDHLLGAAGQGALLKPETYTRLHTDTDEDGYAMGWLVTADDQGNTRQLQHAGSNGRWLAVVRIDLAEAGLEGCNGVVTATNIAHDNAAKACGQTDGAITLYMQARQNDRQDDQPQ